MTTANKITIFRICLVPVFVLLLLRYFRTSDEMVRWAALATFVLAAITDGVDGYIARNYNQMTRLGAVLDPIADKTLLLSALLILSLVGQTQLLAIPPWVLGILLSRDVLVLAGGVVLHVFH